MSEIDFEMETGLDLEATTDVELKDPVSGEPWLDDKKQAVTVSVISGMSEEFQRKAFELQGRYRIKIGKNTGPNKGYPTFDQQKAYKAELYALVMRGWHIVKKNGGPALDIPFSQKNAVNWCLANPLFADQLTAGSDDLDAFVKDVEGNFTSKGSTTSAKTSKPKSG